MCLALVERDLQTNETILFTKDHKVQLGLNNKYAWQALNNPLVSLINN
jgi:hypothetical protein